MRINAQTRFCFLIGYPVQHSLSPTIHNAAYQACGLNYVYLAAPVAEKEIGAAVNGMRALSAAGGNVTSPYKKMVIPFLDSISDEAREIESVNTIVNRNGHLHGSSSDGQGFYQSLKYTASDYDLSQPVLIVGAGGAARAVAYTMASSGTTEMIIVNRSLARAQSLVKLIREKTPIRLCKAYSFDEESLIEQLSRCSLIIYTLPSDLESFISIMCKSSLSFKKSILFDLRYNPAQSKIMSHFSNLGGRSFNGLGMLLWQAVISFEQITGVKAPLLEMRKSVNY